MVKKHLRKAVEIVTDEDFPKMALKLSNYQDDDVFERITLPLLLAHKPEDETLDVKEGRLNLLKMSRGEFIDAVERVIIDVEHLTMLQTITNQVAIVMMTEK